MKFLVVAGFFGVMWLTGVIRGKREIALHTITASNALGVVGLALQDFEKRFGRFPDDGTGAAVKEPTGTTVSLEDRGSSNAYFRQLFVSGYPYEMTFWAKTPLSPNPPDNVSDTDTTMLARGEVGFAYLPGHSSKSHPDTPVAMAPLARDKRTFDREPFGGVAVVLFADGGVKSLPIDEEGRAIFEGMDLFDARQPFWKEKDPDVRWAE